MILSIITINRNNASGLKKTLESVNRQTCKDFEHIVIDGASTDSSVDEILKAEDASVNRRWVSEPDSGIYNAMNKGIRMAEGKYIQILNSGDTLASGSVVEQMSDQLKSNNYPQILVGNMLKSMPDGRILLDRGPELNRPMSFLDFYNGTVNHSPAYIKRELFEKYGYYDESLKVVSDWKWYTKVIAFGGIQPVFVDVDVTLFDMTGISESNLTLTREEKRRETEKMVPKCVLDDYDRFSGYISMMERLKRHPMVYKTVWVMERCLFKIEKRKNRKCCTQ